jgi:hypothetical protein
MSLSDLAFDSAVIKVSDEKNGSFSVRGLSLLDITKIVAEHGAMTSIIFNKIVSQAKDQDGGITGADLQTIFMSVIETAPEAVVDLICLAADDFSDKARANTRKLRIGIQVEALDKIIGLTFVGEAELKKLMDTATRAVQSIITLLNPVATTQISESGFGASDSK